MSTSPQDILKSALELSPQERAEIAGILIESLDEADVDAEAEAAWSDETARRVADLDGGAPTTPWPEVRRKLMGLSDGSEAC